MPSEYYLKDHVIEALDDACKECQDACIEFDGFMADCNQCLLNGAKQKIKALETVKAVGGVFI